MAEDKDTEAQTMQGNSNIQANQGETDNPVTTPDTPTGDLTSRLLSAIREIFKKDSKPTPTTPLIVRSIEDAPNGYPKLGAFIAADENFLVFRRFKYLQARALLHLQDQLLGCERILDGLDHNTTLPSLGPEIAAMQTEQREQLLDEVVEKYERYATIMFYATSMTMRGEPSNTDCRSLDNFIFTHMPLTKEKDYHLHKNDLISLKPRGDTAGVDNIVTKLLLEEPNWAIKSIFRDETRQDGDSTVFFARRYKIRLVKLFLLGVPLMGLLIGPIYPLYILSKQDTTPKVLVASLFIQLGFTALFAGCMKLLARPRRHELFAASVTYLGVLIVFMSQTAGTTMI